VELRTIPEEDYDAYFQMASAAFGENLTPEIAERERSVLEPGRSLGAYDGDQLAAAVAAVSFDLTVPGPRFVPCAGVTSVATSPVYRRRGLARQLLQRQIEDVHERGEPLAYLWASEAVIYQRFGYGTGSFTGAFEIERSRVVFLDDRRPDGRIRLTEREDALKVLPEIYEHVRTERPGTLTRSPAWWDANLWHFHNSAGKDRRVFYGIHESDEGPDGYVIYNIEESWSHSGGPQYVLEIDELMAANDDAYLALWRFCFEVDLVRKIKGWRRPVDEPLLFMLAEPRALAFQLRDATWVRLVDVVPALEGRSYAREGSIRFEVHDAPAPWNEGTYELETASEGASCVRTDEPPDLVLEANALASTYLGAVSFHALARAGRVKERTPGAVARADALFTTVVPPWCPWIF
jgi:predicted acetyltransferase